MNTLHKIYNESSINMQGVGDETVDLVVTSPPYPMVEMWDECFKSQSTFVEQAFDKEMYNQAWLEMHYVLNKVWKEIVRVVKPGGFVCINIGDATRTFDGNFQLFSNHSKIIQYFIENGFVCLPDILWRKRTNAPNKFMGSGMYPAGAYVTFEHENILVFRKGGKRTFTEEQKKIRQESAYFYNERNVWFSDVWEVMGTTQKGVKGSRERSGAYPFEIPYRLINMYSIKGDTVLDPFGGLGTTLMAAIQSERNSISFEIDKSLCDYMTQRVLDEKDWYKKISDRLDNQEVHIKAEKDKGKDKFYLNDSLNREVKTKQEMKIVFNTPCKCSIKKGENNCDTEIEIWYQNYFKYVEELKEKEMSLCGLI